MQCHLMLEHGKDNPRNSEGALAVLADGSLFFAYSRYRGEGWGDHCTADICAVRSADGGTVWSEPEVIVSNRSVNVMSVSLLRLQDGRLAMIYLEKSGAGQSPYIDCRPLICFSSDEGSSWSGSIDMAGVPPAYFVGHNDRLVQLENGRLIFPVSYHRYASGNKYMAGIGLFFLSDDGGQSWRQSSGCCYPVNCPAYGLMEPGVIELENNRLMCWYRTTMGCQYKSFSYDGGETWTIPEAAPEFPTSSAPLSMKRNPATGALTAVWNDYHPLRSVAFEPGYAGRTPLVLAQSYDEGRTWQDHTILENAPDHGYAYTAMLFEKERLFLAYCCGGKPRCTSMLQDCCIKSLSQEQLQKKGE